MKKSELKEKLRPVVEELMRESFVKFIQEGLIEETVKDIVLEGGVIRSIVTEIAQGMAPTQQVVYAQSPPQTSIGYSQQPQYSQKKIEPNQVVESMKRDKENFKNNFLDMSTSPAEFSPSHGHDETFRKPGAVEQKLNSMKSNPLFAGTTPLREGGSPAQAGMGRVKGSGEHASLDVLGDIAPDDSGVDIRNFITKNTENSWEAHSRKFRKHN